MKKFHPKVRNHGEGPSRGLLRDYEPSDGTFSSTNGSPACGHVTAVLSCGWLQVRDPMTGSLREIDECALLPGICRHGRCLNTVGSFTCDCDPGYRCDFHIRASNEPS